jgi:hypothetical protein
MKKLIIILLLFLGFCQIDESIKDSEAYKDFLIAYLYKASQCNSQPSYFLILPKKVPKRWFDACLFSIIRSDCPFNEYPLICFKIYDGE